ncbi:MAG TPA: TIGR02466 family protein [Vineibacter sp.]|nr:TIGR02466 family protein [Vineibacter sp.]
MTVRRLFPTLIYGAALGGRDVGRFNQRLHDEAQALRLHDAAGRRWCATNYVGGYTSYATHDQLHQTSAAFAELARRLAPHVRAYAAALRYDLRRRRLAMTDCWVNLMPARTSHGLHLHPLSFISGTYYVRTPRRAAGLKLEDPRLAALMAAPPRRQDAPEALLPFVTVPARAGRLVLFESWLRHEVPASAAAGERVSVSFNYAWRERG